MKTEYYVNRHELEVDRASHPASWKMPIMHYHDSYELTLFEKGKCNFLIEEQAISAEQFDVFLFAPNVLHKNNGGTFHTRTVIYFMHEYLQNYYTPKAISALLFCFSRKKISLSRKDFDYIFHQAMLLSGKNPFLPLGNILALLSEQPPAETGGTRLIDTILNNIRNHYAEINNLSELAYSSGISKEYLCRLFKKETGLTVTEYLNGVRIRNACDMLRDTKKSITEISFSCGFHSTMYFNKTFKRIVNMTPTEFRKQESAAVIRLPR